MARLEYKYYIPFQFLDNLRRDVSPYLNYDLYTYRQPKREYTVRSIYLDSERLLTYHEKQDGIKQRNKYRIRGYNQQSDDSIVFLEIKRKDVEHISKDRAPLLYNNLEEFIVTKEVSLILNGTNDVTKQTACAQNFLYYYLRHNLKPAVIVTYEREAFECKFGSGLRMTFDKNIRTKITNTFTGLFSEEQMVPSLQKYFVLEVKFHRLLPAWLPSIMKKYDIARSSAPKYSMSIDAVYNNRFIKYSN
ncbi:MAG: polyphosphate polymerase domain-containing protein [Ignavibacteriales bacterium]|nr:polyphosphate polymerase domain-containing protein [Ignavibacteriales bacterium]